MNLRELSNNLQQNFTLSAISFYSLISNHFMQLVSYDNYQKLTDTVFFIKFNHLEILRIIELATTKSSSLIKDTIRNAQVADLVAFAIFLALDFLIIFAAYFANKHHYHYLQFIIQSITRIKIEECLAELKKLRFYVEILSESHHPWIGQDLYQIYFDSSNQDNTHRAQDLRRQREKMNDINSKYSERFEGKLQILAYFIFINLAIVLYSVGQIIWAVNIYQEESGIQDLRYHFEDLHQAMATYDVLYSLIETNSLMGEKLQFQSTELNNIIQLKEEYLNKIISLKDLLLKESSLSDGYKMLFEQYFRNDLCETSQYNNERLTSKMQAACKNQFKYIHLKNGLNQIITGIQDLRPIEQNGFLNNEVEFYIWDFFGFMNDYFDYVDQKIETYIFNQLQSRQKWIIIYYFLGSAVILLTISLMIHTVKFKMINERKGHQVLLSLIPHEKLTLESTVNLLKQLEKL